METYRLERVRDLKHGHFVAHATEGDRGGQAAYRAADDRELDGEEVRGDWNGLLERGRAEGLAGGSGLAAGLDDDHTTAHDDVPSFSSDARRSSKSVHLTSR